MNDISNTQLIISQQYPFQQKTFEQIRHTFTIIKTFFVGFFVHRINWCLWLDHKHYASICYLVPFFLSDPNPVVHERWPPSMAQLSQGKFLISLKCRRSSLIYLRPQNPFLRCFIRMVKPDVLVDPPGDEVFQVVLPLPWHAVGEGGDGGEEGDCEQNEDDGASHTGQDGMEVRGTIHSFMQLLFDGWWEFNPISNLCPLSKDRKSFPVIFQWISRIYWDLHRLIWLEGWNWIFRTNVWHVSFPI